MRVALVNPAWSFDGSIYFGCREPHLPLEFGYARALLEQDGHEAAIIDGHAAALTNEQLAEQVSALAPELVVVTTAPSYLFWRCPPPELRVPRETLAALSKQLNGAVKLAVVGPHPSTSPVSTLRKLGADVAVLGECEEVVLALANERPEHWDQVPSVALRGPDGRLAVNGGPRTTRLEALPPLSWPDEVIAAHRHHHHRFDAIATAPGAEIEWSRGCPYRCTFCAKETHRDKYRKRPLATVLAEVDRFRAQGVEYLYFIDEIFLPERPLLEALRERRVKFGVQTRIDLWSFELLDLLGAAGCVTIEAGIESVSADGRDHLDKRCRLDNDALTARLLRARQTVPFVQATLMESKADDPSMVTAWRDELVAQGVWVNEPVPLFPYPGSPDYRRLWGEPDERAWERAHAYYLGNYERFSDIQEQRFVHLPVLEGTGAGGA